jgi:hypothetical protein
LTSDLFYLCATGGRDPLEVLPQTNEYLRSTLVGRICTEGGDVGETGFKQTSNETTQGGKAVRLQVCDMMEQTRYRGVERVALQRMCRRGA